MKNQKKIGIVIDEDFAIDHNPPFPKPTFIAYENPVRIKGIIEFLTKKNIFNDNFIIKLKPEILNEEILLLAHTPYHIESIRKIAHMGGGLLEEDVFISEDSFELAKKAVSGAILALEKIINNEFMSTFAIIRPPGHHASREKASGLCIFNNIANSILYLRNLLNYKGKIAIIDIDNHYGDGLAKYFYEDPSVLYFSIHEFDFSQPDLGFIDEIGHGNGLGKNISFPIPEGLNNAQFLEIMDFFIPILKEFGPSLIIIAVGLDMYFDDPIGNCCLTSYGYYRFTQRIIKLAEEICNGKISFILEGGYSIIGLQYSVFAMLSALLEKEHTIPEFEHDIDFPGINPEELNKIKKALKKQLSPFWNCLKIENKKT